MNRRQFAFWVGFGLFSLSDRLRINALDTLAAAVMPYALPPATSPNYDLIPEREKHNPPEPERPVFGHDHHPDGKIRKRNGQPPSKWLRSLTADELRIWLKTIKVPEVGVEGMTVTFHLVYHPSFARGHLAGLTGREQ